MNLCCQKVHIFQQKEEKDILPQPTLLEGSRNNGCEEELNWKCRQHQAPSWSTRLLLPRNLSAIVHKQLLIIFQGISRHEHGPRRRKYKGWEGDCLFILSAEDWVLGFGSDYLFLLLCVTPALFVHTSVHLLSILVL